MGDERSARRGRGGAIGRAERDLAEGRAWLAARRLRDRLVHVGHDDATLQALAATSLAMGDECAAGRWFLLSGACDEAAERAVDRYVAAFAGGVAAAVEAAPDAARLCAVRKLPEPALKRLQRLGFPIPADRSVTLLRHAAPDRSSRTRAKNAGCMLGFVLFVTLLVVGLVAWVAVGVRTLVNW